jgi:site-specific DNA recombinase
MSHPQPPDATASVLAEVGAVLGNIESDRAARRRATTANFGPRGFGHVHDRSRTVEVEAAAIRDAARRVLGGQTLSSVVQEWNSRGLRTTTGGPWRVNSLSALLIQPRLAGLDVNGRGTLVEKWPAVVDIDTHQALVALRSSRGLQRRPPRRSLLNGLLRCGRCKGSLHFLYRSDANQYYRCPAPAAGGCSGVIVKATLVEDHVKHLVLARVGSPELTRSVRSAFEPVEDVRAAVQEAADAVRDDLERLKELAVLWADRQITWAEWQPARADIARRLEVNEARLRQFDEAKALLDLVGTGDELAAAWSSTSVDHRRELIRTLVDHVVVEPVGGTGGKFRPERLHAVWRH